MNTLDQTKIVAQCAQAKRDLEQALRSSRRDMHLPHRDIALLSPREARNLRAVTPKAQILWNTNFATVVIDHLVDSGKGRVRENVYLVTLCDISCITEVGDRDPQIATYKTRLRKGLRGVSFIGVIEPGYYTNIQAGARVSHTKCVSWHLHVIVWGPEETTLRSLIADLNRSGNYRAIAPNRPGAHCKKIKDCELPETLGYILKPPTTAYRLSIWVKEGRKTSKQGKSRLRPGERLNLFNAMKGLSLPELALAGGEGARLLAEIKIAYWKASCS